MNINISRSLMLLAITVTLGLVGAFGLQKFIYEKLKVTGPTYTTIVDSKVLLADILPPPLYVVESYMLAYEAVLNPELAEKSIARIKELQGEYTARKTHWLDSSYETPLVEQLESGVLSEGEIYWTLMNGKFLPAIRNADIAAATAALKELSIAFHASDTAVKALVEDVSAFDEKVRADAIGQDILFSALTLVASLLSVGIFLAGLFVFRQRAIVPLTAMKDYMQVLSDGDFARDVPYAERNDEIGEMARSVAYFRDAAMERDTVRAQGEKVRREKDELDATTAEQKAIEDADRVRVIETVTTGLEHLSAGNLGYRIHEPFAPDYEKLRMVFNVSIDTLSQTIQEIRLTTNSVRLASSEIGAAADNLSQRTEQQAASLEETAAALDEITSAVKNSALRAEEASDMVGQTKSGAEDSGKVVQSAILAMEKIADSSKRISQIISVIDDIAFQTNLLALNAGVEAARAGDAGRGFAVVAQEVRELAQRSANAAKEIKTLIHTSSTQVGTGVALVNETGTALGKIETQVVQINDLIRSIVTGAREQSSSLAEINTAINHMDQVTQQNAAMVEQTNAATQELSGEAVKLDGLVARFGTGTTVSRSAPPQTKAPVAAGPSSLPAQSPARALGAKLASAFGLSTASAAARQDENWDGF